MHRLLLLLLCFPTVVACSFMGTEPPPVQEGTMTVTLFATPKIISDFDAPAPEARAFLEHYEPLLRPARETVLIFAVGNSNHILLYPGPDGFERDVEWARWIHHEDRWEATTEATLNYRQIAGVIAAFKAAAAEMGITLKVFDQFDKGREFAHNHWKFSYHPECFDIFWDAWDIRGSLKSDDWVYASHREGIPEGYSCGKFLVDQVSQYMTDLGFDGILYGNQLGTRGAWTPDNGPGYSDAEAQAIEDFLRYSDEMYGDRELMWFDSYNPIPVEHDTYSFPASGYRHFDYVMASGFCVVTYPRRYLDNLASKITLRDRTRVLPTLDYVDPWYVYDSMVDFPQESAFLEDVAVDNRDRIDGVVFFANDEWGVPVPREKVELFARRFYRAS